MSYPLGTGELATLRCRSHWHADLYKITPKGGGPAVRISTLDTKLWYLGEQYVPTAGDAFDATAESNLAGGDTELVGVLGPDTIQPVDVQRGTFDDARVDQYSFDWLRRKRYRHDVWWVDEVNQDGLLWRASLTSMSRFLQQVRGNAHSTICPAVLGDDKCGATVTEYTLSVSAVTDPQMELDCSGGPALQNHFQYGSLTWTTGNNRGVRSRVLASTAAGHIQLSQPTRFSIKVGDAFIARPGCDGLATTCKIKFANLLNFRGNERQRNSKQLILARGAN